MAETRSVLNKVKEELSGNRLTGIYTALSNTSSKTPPSIASPPKTPEIQPTLADSYVTTSSRYGESTPPSASSKSTVQSICIMAETRGVSCDNEINCYKTVEEIKEEIRSLHEDPAPCKHRAPPFMYHRHYSIHPQEMSITPDTPCQVSATSKQHQQHQQQQQQQQQQQATQIIPPICLCGVTNMQEENLRLRQGLVAKHNEVVHLRGMMMGQDMCPKQGQPQWAPMCVDARLPAGGSSTRGCGKSEHRSAIRRNSGYYSSSMQMRPDMLDCPSVATELPYSIPRCPHRAEDYMTQLMKEFAKSANIHHSATVIIEESRRQMEKTEHEIKTKLQKIKCKKNELEHDISTLQKCLLEKQQNASINMQAARAVKASEMVQDAHMSMELHKMQRMQALEGAKAAMFLQQAQERQSLKQHMAAKSADKAQQAQCHQLEMAARAVNAAEMAEEAQNEQAAQAEAAAVAAMDVKAAQEQQHCIAHKQLRDADELRRNQEEQACRAAQASEALHAAQLAQVAQEAQMYNANTQAHSVLTHHNFIPIAMSPCCDAHPHRRKAC